MTTRVTESRRRAGSESKTAAAGPLSPEELRKMHAYWRAANYLSVGQIYLMDNPLLKEPVQLKHVKPRLLGHWGTTSGQNFLYVHLNRVIKLYDLNMLYISGPGHGGPALVANAYLEGTYSEVYPNIGQDEAGLKRLFTQFSFPGGIPSHVAPETPGSIHEGGELGYALSHAYGAAFDNPDVIVACVVGDGEAETGPLATGWHGNKFLNPVRDGCVLPILHLNGYKIANPTVLARISHEELDALMRGYGYTPYFVEGDDPTKMHQLLAGTLVVISCFFQKAFAVIVDIDIDGRAGRDLRRKLRRRLRSSGSRRNASRIESARHDPATCRSGRRACRRDSRRGNASMAGRSPRPSSRKPPRRPQARTPVAYDALESIARSMLQSIAQPGSLTSPALAW